MRPERTCRGMLSLLSMADELGAIAGSYGIFECKDAAKAMADYLTKKGFEFGFISIKCIMLRS